MVIPDTKLSVKGIIFAASTNNEPFVQLFQIIQLFACTNFRLQTNREQTPQPPNIPGQTSETGGRTVPTRAGHPGAGCSSLCSGFGGWILHECTGHRAHQGCCSSWTMPRSGGRWAVALPAHHAQEQQGDGKRQLRVPHFSSVSRETLRLWGCTQIPQTAGTVALAGGEKLLTARTRLSKVLT